MIGTNLRLNRFTGIILGLILTGAMAPAQAQSTPLNLISEIKGNVLLKRSQWQNFKKANVGDLLNVSDQLQLEGGASATVLCNNLKIWQVPKGRAVLISDGCGTGGVVAMQPNSSVIRSRGSAGLYVISPRNTHVLSDRPLFRWNAVPGADKYTVQLIAEGSEPIWQMETDKTEIEYPGEPVLQPGVDYWLTIKTDNGTFGATPIPKFQRLDREKSLLIQQQIQQIKAQKLSPEAETLAISHFYQVYNLNAEAIALLEGLINQGSSQVSIYKLLGQSYRRVGLEKESQTAYLQALTLAQQTQDISAQAEIQYQLGDIQLELNNLPEAKKLMLQSQKSYKDLGDSTKTQEIDQLLQEMGHK